MLLGVADALSFRACSYKGAGFVKILILDPNASSARAIALLCSDLGHETLMVRTMVGLRGALARVTAFELAIVDGRWGEGSPDHEEIVLLLSAFVMAAVRLIVLDEGHAKSRFAQIPGASWLVKPVDPKKLEERIQTG